MTQKVIVYLLVILSAGYLFYWLWKRFSDKAGGNKCDCCNSSDCPLNEKKSKRKTHADVHCKVNNN